MQATSTTSGSNHADAFDATQPLHVRLYGRPGCHLCNDAALVLKGLHADFDFWVERVNIDEDDAIKSKLNDHIPVVTINGGNRVQEPVTEEKLRRAFKRALKAEDQDSQREAQAVEAV